jgi:C2 domain
MLSLRESNISSSNNLAHSLETDAPASLHVFVSTIKCWINASEYTKTRGKGDTPSPFVCFVSNPREAIRTETTKWENMFRKVGIHTLKTSKAKGKNKDDEANNVVSRTMGGWPRTRKLANTFAPEWKDGDETVFKVRTQGPDGSPLDLSGAMLHITVMDGKVSGEPRLVGSFTLNLTRLLSLSGGIQEDIAVTQSSGLACTSKSEGASPALKMAMKKHLLDDSVDEEIDRLQVVSLKLDEMLIEGGVDVGRIVCHIDAWWTVEESGTVFG